MYGQQVRQCSSWQGTGLYPIEGAGVSGRGGHTFFKFMAASSRSLMRQQRMRRAAGRAKAGTVESSSCVVASPAGGSRRIEVQGFGVRAATTPTPMQGAAGVGRGVAASLAVAGTAASHMQQPFRAKQEYGTVLLSSCLAHR